MALSKDVIDEVKERADIVQIVGERVHLKPSGDGFLGLCPFHGEKTPSFRVSPSRRIYHCFGCGAGGSVIDFVMATENLEFAEAVATLAERVGVALPQGRQPAVGGRAMEALAWAQDRYRAQLTQRPEAEAARRYLYERDFGESAWARFALGYALDDWQGLTGAAQREGFTLEDLVATGLVRQGQTGRAYDLLRNRVVFPIPNEQGRPIGFGGRVIRPEDEPKYLNTPETRFYRKSRVLFGLAQGRERLRETGRALLAEGYLDVMRLHEHGFAEAMATCGTALTSEHLKLLERYVQRVVLVFDGDEAGVKAALRSAPLFLDRGLEARVVLLPDNLDPDDFLRREGGGAFTERLGEATPILEFLVFQLLSRNGRGVEGKQRTLEALVPVLSAVQQEATRDLSVRYLADLVGVRTESVLAMLAPTSRGARGRDDAPQPVPLPPRQDRHQRRFLRILLSERRLLGEARELLSPEALSDPALRRLFEKVLRLSEDELAATSPEALMELWPDLAPTLRELMLEDVHHQHALADSHTELAYEAVCIREDAHAHLRQEVRRQLEPPPEGDPPAALTEAEVAAVQRLREARASLTGGRNRFRRTHRLRPELTVRGPERGE